MTDSDRESALIVSIVIFVMACLTCCFSCSTLVDALGQIHEMKESLDAMSVRLEAVQEAQKSVQVRTFDVRDFPPVEDEPTICTPEDLEDEDDPTDPYKPGGPAGETGARSAGVSSPAPLHI